jgi:hypothetical protein
MVKLFSAAVLKWIGWQRFGVTAACPPAHRALLDAAEHA